MTVTTGRADYGLLHPLITEIELSGYFDHRLVVTGSHLSEQQGRTVRFITDQDGIEVADTVDMASQGDSESQICESIARGLSEFSKVFQKHSPDLIIVLGDRYELWSVCIPAVIHKIPIAHIHGGECTYGIIDDPIRHSITKMATFHFASAISYAQRIVQMGEDPDRVFVVGALGVDAIRQVELMTREDLMAYTQVDFNRDVALLTYHPVTFDSAALIEEQIRAILEALTGFEVLVLMTMPNADTHGGVIYRVMLEYQHRDPSRFFLIKSLGQKAYLSAMRHAAFMIGNSSSGIIESPSFKLPVVNIGDRQEGRMRSRNIIDCPCEQKAITRAVATALSTGFAKSMTDLESPYGNGDAAKKIVQVLISVNYGQIQSLLKKGFRNIPFKVCENWGDRP